MRAEFQVLVLCYVLLDEPRFLILKRRDMSIWQFVSGGGEDNETPLEATIRELYEETSIEINDAVKLDTVCSIPKSIFKEHRDKSDIYIIPEYSFAVKLESEKILLSSEHIEYKFCTYEEGMKLLKYDSNRTALYELNERFNNDDL